MIPRHCACISVLGLDIDMCTRVMTLLSYVFAMRERERGEREGTAGEAKQWRKSYVFL